MAVEIKLSDGTVLISDTTDDLWTLKEQMTSDNVIAIHDQKSGGTFHVSGRHVVWLREMELPEIGAVAARPGASHRDT